MNRKQTGELKIMADRFLSENEVVINPNDGFDLGLMMTEASVELYFGDSSDQIQGQLIQKNECKLGTVELGPKSIQKLEEISSVRLYLEEQEGFPKLFINSV